MRIVSEINAMVKGAEGGKAARSSARFPAQANGAAISAVPAKFDRGKFQNVYDFYNDIAPAIRMRELGVEKLPDEEADAFASLSSIPVEIGKLPKGVGGRHVRTDDGLGSKKIILSDDKSISDFTSRATLAHELRHALARKMRPGRGSEGFLNRIFGFLGKGVDINPRNPGYQSRLAAEELFTTNKEHQYRAYENLRNKLGRKPTAEEYFSHIDRMPEYELFNNRKTEINSYQKIADKVLGIMGMSRRLKEYREALKSISMNRNPRGGISTMSAGIRRA